MSILNNVFTSLKSSVAFVCSMKLVNNDLKLTACSMKYKNDQFLTIVFKIMIICNRALLPI